MSAREERIAAHTPACSGPSQAPFNSRCGPIYCVECSAAAHDWVTWTPEHVAAALDAALGGREGSLPSWCVCPDDCDCDGALVPPGLCEDRRRGGGVSAPRLHDYCCCAGLGADGYAAIFGAASLHGYDHEPQPDYPYGFTQADVMRMLADGLPPADARHFSFPCQIHTTASHLRTAQGGVSKYADLLTPGLAIVRARYNDTPWVIENVDDRSGNVRRIMAPRDGESLIMLCGSMFGLAVQRHRLFLANFPLRRPTPVPGGGKYRAQGCDHSTFPIGHKGKPKPIGVYHVKGDRVPEGGHTARDEEHGRQVMGSHRLLPWDKLKEGFPPAYTAWVGADLLAELQRRAVRVEEAA